MSHCYLNDVMEFKGEDLFAASDYKSCSSDKPCTVKATIKGKCYKDADAYCKILYSDLNVLFGRLLSKKLFVNNVNSLRLSDGVIRYSSDYIGPSRHWAKINEISDEDIGRSILLCRTIGGHMLWPVHKVPTINTARGGKSSFFDRIDLTLYEIKRYYEGKTFCAFDGKRSLWNVISSGNDERAFFSMFTDFKNFIDTFYLNSFVNDKYEVISLVRSDLKNERFIAVDETETVYLHDNYSLFMKNNIDAVQSRTEALITFAKDNGLSISDTIEAGERM